MKRNTFLTGALITILLLAACGPLEFAEYPTRTEYFYTEATETPSVDQQAEPAQDELSMEMKLLIGTLRLDGTDLEVTADQAKELFPLWARLKGALASMTLEVEDIEAITSQIQSVMTPEQLQTIDDMNLTYQDMITLMEEMNISLGHWDDFDPAHDEDQLTPEATPEENQEPTPTEAETTPGQEETPHFPGGGNMERWSHMVPPDLLDALIEYLQGKQ